MKQQTLAMAVDKGFEQFHRPTKRDVFLNILDKVMLWEEFCAVVQPRYSKSEGERPPVRLERMPHMLLAQHWINLTDEACEEAPHDGASLRSFVGIDLGRERVPDSTTTTPKYPATLRDVSDTAGFEVERTDSRTEDG